METPESNLFLLQHILVPKSHLTFFLLCDHLISYFYYLESILIIHASITYPTAKLFHIFIWIILSISFFVSFWI